MPARITLDSVRLSAPDGRPLLSDLSLVLGNERTGIVGRNGSGKTTLLDAVLGRAEPASGSISRAGSVAMLGQIPPAGGTSAAEALGISEALARLARIQSGKPLADDVEHADWTLEARVEAALRDAEVSVGDLDRPVASLSGGERTRLAVARLLIARPDIMLLDEPTNNLDARGRALIARLIDGFRGGVVVASHDRALLERMDRIVELSPTGVTVVGGCWSAFSAARDAARARADAELGRAEAELERTRAAVQREREKKARRERMGRASRRARSNSKLLLDAEKERSESSAARGGRVAARLVGEAAQAVETARMRVEVLTPLKIDLPPTGLAARRDILAFDRVTLAFAGRKLFGPLSFSVTGPERIALRGANGSGKTSLLRLVAGEIAPTSGAIRLAVREAALLDQHVAILDPGQSLLDNMRRLNPRLDDNAAHAALARFSFRNDDALKPAAALSGGERLRAGLACVLSRARPPQLLMLDEPTNHLDIHAIEVLEAALAGFDGALLVASHDPAFIEAIGIGREVAL